MNKLFFVISALCLLTYSLFACDSSTNSCIYAGAWLDQYKPDCNCSAYDTYCRFVCNGIQLHNSGK